MWLTSTFIIASQAHALSRGNVIAFGRGSPKRSNGSGVVRKASTLRVAIY